MLTPLLQASLLAATLASAAVLSGDDDVAKKLRPFYPLDTCIVSGEALVHSAASEEQPAMPLELVIGDRLFRLCSKECAEKVKEDEDSYGSLLDDAVAKDQLPHYPLTTCPLSDEPLKDSVQLVMVEGRLVKLCCKQCLHSLRVDPQPAFAALDAGLIKAQTADYPLKSCPLSDEPLGERPRDVLYGSQLVRLCCASCVRKFKASPEQVVAMVKAALPERKSDGASGSVHRGVIQRIKPMVEGEAPRGRGGRGGR